MISFLKLINAVNPREEKACGVGGELQVQLQTRTSPSQPSRRFFPPDVLGLQVYRAPGSVCVWELWPLTHAHSQAAHVPEALRCSRPCRGWGVVVVRNPTYHTGSFPVSMLSGVKFAPLKGWNAKKRWGGCYFLY